MKATSGLQQAEWEDKETPFCFPIFFRKFISGFLNCPASHPPSLPPPVLLTSSSSRPHFALSYFHPPPSSSHITLPPPDPHLAPPEGGRLPSIQTQQEEKKSVFLLMAFKYIPAYSSEQIWVSAYVYSCLRKLILHAEATCISLPKNI